MREEKAESQLLEIDASWGGKIKLAYPGDELSKLVAAELMAGEYPMPPLNFRDAEGCVIDLGANVGAFSVLAASFFTKAVIVAYEPDSRAMAFLEHNTRTLNDLKARVGISQSAVMDVAASERVVTTLLRGKTSTVTSSLFTTHENGEDEESVFVIPASQVYDVTTRHHGKCLYLKIDTEGAELPILVDLGERIKDIMFLAVEYHAEEDRRSIDQMVRPWFDLITARSVMCHRGTLCYAHRRFIADNTDWNLWRINR